MPDIKAIQTELRAAKIDGWLFCDFRHSDTLAYSILGLNPAMATRRWFYLIPASGQPRKLVHRIESANLDVLPGTKILYAGLDELRASIPKVLGRGKVLAMQYSPMNNIPYVSKVDAGTIELIKSFGKKIVTSAELVQKFEARWTSDQLHTHYQAGRVIDRIIQQAFGQVSAYIKQGKEITEYELMQWMRQQFRANLLSSEDGPVVAVGPHSGDPHYEPTIGNSSVLAHGDLLLLDVWGKTSAPGSVFYDVTWMGYLGDKVPEKYTKIFNIVKVARDTGVNFVQEAVKKGRTVHGWEVDNATRAVIQKAGYGKYFVHRTGHSIGTTVHGNGANMDGLETKDDRCVIPHTCFSVEPGIYLPEFGVRSEVNVYVADRQARVTGAIQSEIIPILA